MSFLRPGVIKQHKPKSSLSLSLSLSLDIFYCQAESIKTVCYIQRLHCRNTQQIFSKIVSHSSFRLHLLTCTEIKRTCISMSKIDPSVSLARDMVKCVYQAIVP